MPSGGGQLAGGGRQCSLSTERSGPRGPRGLPGHRAGGSSRAHGPMARGKGLVWRLLRVALPRLMRGLGPQDVRACELPPEPRAPEGPEQGARRALDRSRPLQCALPARPPSGARARPGRCGSDAAVAGTRLSSCEQLGHPAQAGGGDPGGVWGEDTEPGQKHGVLAATDTAPCR